MVDNTHWLGHPQIQTVAKRKGSCSCPDSHCQGHLRGSILHYLFNRMNWLPFIEWSGRGWWETTAIDISWTKQKTAEGTADRCMIDYGTVHIQNIILKQADTNSKCWRGKSISEKIHMICTTSVYMLYACLFDTILFYIFVYFSIFLKWKLKN